ncbi:MAG: class I SAM-dependent methyltransferase [Desulfobacterales bacterium]|nr:class I SAM-dependent methyltransferase [Desulfobacterales bacterium]
MEKVKFSQLWIEEEQYLREQSAQLQDNSIAVEIGTAQGGSAYILATSTNAQEMTIHTYDISPSKEAHNNLRGIDCIVFHAKSSVEGAKEWGMSFDNKIDFLFIDGSHTLENIFHDFLLWFPHVKEGGVIAIHDYDPVHRGGFAHLGVKVCVDAILNLNALVETEHIGRIIGGKKGCSVTEGEFLEQCYYSWKKIGQKVISFRQFSLDQCNMIGEEDELVSILRKLKGATGKCLSEPPIRKENKIMVLPQPFSKSTFQFVSENKNTILLDELTFFYLLWELLLNNRSEVIQITQNKRDFFKWEEILEMFDHANSIEKVDDIFEINTTNIHTLSQICARELVRVNILKNIFLSMTGGI